jgi:hypothetical protein
MKEKTFGVCCLLFVVCCLLFVRFGVCCFLFGVWGLGGLGFGRFGVWNVLRFGICDSNEFVISD